MNRFAIACIALLPTPALSSRTSAEDVRFNEHIRPILAEHCLHCHGPDECQRQADLRLDLEAEAKRHAIVPHKPDESELLRRLTTTNTDERMPPRETGKSLTAGQIALVRKWIEQGAKYEGHWSFEPIAKPAVPKIDDAQLTDIDRFILNRLRAAKLELSPSVGKQQLIRRATFDLTGLPPEWSDVVAFVNDDSPDAFDKVIDRLLDSPRYGERWGRHWLDIARYADTHGGAAIGFTKFPFSYTYRDYVIQAFNADVPYNRFVMEQLAADQLNLAENDPALAGLGFLTVGMQFRNPHDTIDDQIDVVTRGLMGLTVACARCHDHKFDAIPTTDYYSLYAALGSSEQPPLLPVIGTPEDNKPYRAYQRELKLRQRQREDMAREQTEVMRNRLRMQVGMYLRELAKGTPEQDLSAAFLSYRTDDVRPLVLNRWRDYLKNMKDDDPVFGLWVRLAKLKPEGFAEGCAKLVVTLTKENGAPPPANLASNAPQWNPRVMEAMKKRKPKSLHDVADAYGKLFADAQREWLQALLATSLEAEPGGKVVPDEDPRHAVVNSAVNRQLRRHLYAPGTPTAMPDAIAQTLLNRPVRDNLRGREGTIHNLHLSSPGSPPRAMVLREEETKKSFHVFRRGSSINRGQPVNARFLTALGGKEAKAFPAGKRRLGLAQAIVDPHNPLTRRVIVNWVWMHHFGRGLVRTPDDFGTRGQPPTHPQLLDHLAGKFLEDGWSLKRLHRRMMRSQVYRLGAVEDANSRTIDPDNRLLWRMPRRRLDLEAMRDAMLAVSGELDVKFGGRPFDMAAKKVVPRRSVYAFVNRDIVSNFASTFDAADPNSCTAKRPVTTVPQQTLFALNSDFIQDRARGFASRKESTSAKTDVERVRYLVRRAFSREPSAREVELALSYIQSKSGKQDAWQRFAHVLLAANEFVFVD